ncbi:MAG TPA: hypothetical protein VEI01_12075 [Terriglobales bacterium]|nr:hypothetical protein [Terriglobales bacterium]
MSKPDKSTRGCVICGTTVALQCNHVGGQNHVAWFRMWFCVPHHDQFHALVRAAGIDLEYSHDPRERLLRALQATMVCQWMLTDALKNLSGGNNETNPRAFTNKDDQP